MKWKTGNVFIEGLVDYDRCLPMLRKWFDDEMSELYKVPAFSPDSLAIVLGTPVWGEVFVQRFLDICIPTLLAPENVEALAGNSVIVLFVDEPNFGKLCEGIKILEKYGIGVEIHLIPQEIIEISTENPLNKYWLLGTVQNLIIQMAKRKNMGFHMLMPDHLYSKAYFENLFRLAKKHEAIAQTTISGDYAACLPELERFRVGDAIIMDGVQVGDMAYRNMHKQNHSMVMNNRDYPMDMPDSHYYFFVGKDRLHIYCCHMSIAYLSPRLVHFAPLRLHNAVDVELPSFMPEEVYVPTMEDNMAFTELSDDTKGHSDARVPFTQFALRCWMTTFFLSHYERFFAMKNVVPIAKQYEYMLDEHIENVQSVIHEMLVQSRDAIYQAFVEAEKDAEAA